MNIKTFCRCSLFPSWSGEGLISTPVVPSLQDMTDRLSRNVCKLLNTSCELPHRDYLHMFLPYVQ